MSSAEIASAYVRIRPNVSGFQSEATAGVKGALSKIQSEVAASARSNVASTQTEINANEALTASYEQVRAVVRQNIAVVTEGVAANKLLAKAYTEAGLAAKAGSVEQITATKLAAEASLGAATTVAEAARANVAATVLEIEANEKLALSYREIAASAAAGSAEQIAATKLAASATVASARTAVAASAEMTAATEASSAAVGTLRSSVGKLGALVGIAFGAKIAFEFGKDIIEHAASVQKQIEAIRIDFGAASEEVLKFSETGAAALGISAHAAETTAAQFGILFKNLGIAPDLAATMTVNFEKLAGSIALIRGIDPAVALQNLPLAVAGNLRSLKQLGIATDQAQLQIAAFKLGLTQSITQGLTPAQRAIAIYAIATKNLDDYQRQVAESAGDVANREAVLSAEWDNIKDSLGQGLLPVMTSLVTMLSVSLPVAARITQTAFSAMKDDVLQFAKFVGPAFEPVGRIISKIQSDFKGGDAKEQIGAIRAELEKLQKSATGPRKTQIGVILDELKSVTKGGGAAQVAEIQNKLDQLQHDPLSKLKSIKLGVKIDADATGVQEIQEKLASLGGRTEQIQALQSQLANLGKGTDAPARIQAIQDKLAALGKGGDADGIKQIQDQLAALGSDRSAARIKAIQDGLEGFGKTQNAAGVKDIQAQLAQLSNSDNADQIAKIQESLAGLGEGGSAAKIEGIQAQIAALAQDSNATGIQKIRNQLADFATGSGGISSGIGRLKKDFEDLSPAGKGAALAVGLVTVALGAMVVAAFPITGAILAVAGLAVAFKLAYSHSAKFRDIVGQVGDFITGRLVPAIKQIAKDAAPAFAQLWKTASAAFEAIKAVVRVAVAVITETWNRFGATVTEVAKTAFQAVVRLVTDALRILQGIIDVFTGVLTLNWGKAWGGLKTIVSAELDEVKAVVVGFATAVSTVFSNLWKSVELVTLEGLHTLLDLLSKVPTQFDSHLPGVGKVGPKNPFEAWSESLQATIDGIKDGKKQKELQDAVAATTAAAVKAKTTDPVGITASAQELGKKVGDEIKKGTAKGTHDGVTTGIQTGAESAIATARQQLAALNARLAEAQKKLVSDVTAAVKKAKENLVTIGGKLAEGIGEALDAPLVDASTRIKDAGDKIALAFDTVTSKIDLRVARLQLAQSKIIYSFRAANVRLDAEAARLSLLQSKSSLRGDQRSLKALLDEAILPTGNPLSRTPAAAVKQLQAIAKRADQVNRPAIEAYIQQIQDAALTVAQDKNSLAKGKLSARENAKLTPSAAELAKLGITKEQLALARTIKETPLQLANERITVQQDAVDKIKIATTRQINELTTAFTKTGNFKKFTNGIHKLLTSSSVHKAVVESGKFLGVAFETGFAQTAAGILQQAVAIRNAPQRKGTGQDSTIVRPLVTFQKDTAIIKKIQGEIGHKQITLQTKINANAKKTAETLKKIHDVQLGRTAKAVSGKQSKTSADFTGSGG